MFKLINHLLLLVTMLCSLACGIGEPAKNRAEASELSAIRGARHQVQISDAQNFSVTYHDDWKLVALHFKSDARAIEFDQKLVLIPRGTQTSLPDSLEDAWVIEVPVQSVAANEDGEITRLKSLGLIVSIAAMGGGDIYDPELRERWENKQIASIGYSFHAVPKPELLMSSGAELLILHTFDNARLQGMEKLRALGINAIPQFAWGEKNFLAKAEWIKFTALFFNKEEEANQLYDQIKSRCQTLIDLVASQPNKVNSFLLYHPSENGDWSAHRNDFYASYLQAVSNNVLKDDGPTHSVGINNETLLQLAKDADFWLVNNTDDSQWPPLNFLNSFKAYQKGQVYHYQKRTRHEHNAYDWYETPEVRPDLVLADLVAVFYPELLPEHELMYLDKVELTKK